MGKKFFKDQNAFTPCKLGVGIFILLLLLAIPVHAGTKDESENLDIAQEAIDSIYEEDQHLQKKLIVTSLIYLCPKYNYLYGEATTEIAEQYLNHWVELQHEIIFRLIEEKQITEPADRGFLYGYIKGEMRGSLSKTTYILDMMFSFDKVMRNSLCENPLFLLK